MGLDPTKKLAIQKKPMMVHMKRLDPKGKLGNVGKIGEFLNDGVIDKEEAKQLGLDGNRSYDMNKKEDVAALINDIKANTTKKAPSTMKEGEKPPTPGLE